jgi:nicotinamide mononucleotide transporter
VWIFFNGKLYADMSLQVYYLAISFLGWYWWLRGDRRESENKEDKVEGGKVSLPVTRLKVKTGVYLALVFLLLYTCMWFILTYFTDSPVPGWDSFITSLSIVATWMLARKIYEHWYLWIIVNTVSAILFLSRGLYPTLVLYIIYGIMSFSGLRVWKRTMNNEHL